MSIPLGILLAVSAWSQASTQRDSTRLIRQEKQVEVDGVRETWRLQWRSPPKPECGVNDAGWITGPCSGFAFGEAGILDLVRLRGGRQVNRLPLTPLFDLQHTQEKHAVVRRWEPRLSDSPVDDGLEEEVAQRPVYDVMVFADYDHDGRATEFFLQTTNAPTFKKLGMVVGLSRGTKTLDVFKTEQGWPILLRVEQWEKLRETKVAVETLSWGCGDHGGQTETTHLLSFSRTGIQVIEREYQCADFVRGPLLKQTVK